MDEKIKLLLDSLGWTESSQGWYSGTARNEISLRAQILAKQNDQNNEKNWLNAEGDILSGKKKILVVSNNVTSDDSLVSLLLNYTIDIATSKEDALEFFSGKQYDLILTSLDLPNKSGFEVIREIRKLNKQIPIVALCEEKAPDAAEIEKTADKQGLIQSYTHGIVKGAMDARDSGATTCEIYSPLESMLLRGTLENYLEGAKKTDAQRPQSVDVVQSSQGFLGWIRQVLSAVFRTNQLPVNREVLEKLVQPDKILTTAFAYFNDGDPANAELLLSTVVSGDLVIVYQQQAPIKDLKTATTNELFHFSRGTTDTKPWIIKCYKNPKRNSIVEYLDYKELLKRRERTEQAITDLRSKRLEKEGLPNFSTDANLDALIEGTNISLREAVYWAYQPAPNLPKLFVPAVDKGKVIPAKPMSKFMIQELIGNGSGRETMFNYKNALPLLGEDDFGRAFCTWMECRKNEFIASLQANPLPVPQEHKEETRIPDLFAEYTTMFLKHFEINNDLEQKVAEASQALPQFHNKETVQLRDNFRENNMFMSEAESLPAMMEALREKYAQQRASLSQWLGRSMTQIDFDKSFRYSHPFEDKAKREHHPIVDAEIFDYHFMTVQLMYKALAGFRTGAIEYSVVVEARKIAEKLEEEARKGAFSERLREQTKQLLESRQDLFPYKTIEQAFEDFKRIEIFREARTATWVVPMTSEHQKHYATIQAHMQSIASKIRHLDEKYNTSRPDLKSAESYKILEKVYILLSEKAREKAGPYGI